MRELVQFVTWLHKHLFWCEGQRLLGGMTRVGNAQFLGWHGYRKMLVNLCSNFVIGKILVNPSVLALTCYDVYYFGWSPLCKQLVLPNEKTCLDFV